MWKQSHTYIKEHGTFRGPITVELSHTEPYLGTIVVTVAVNVSAKPSNHKHYLIQPFPWRPSGVIVSSPVCDPTAALTLTTVHCRLSPFTLGQHRPFPAKKRTKKVAIKLQTYLAFSVQENPNKSWTFLAKKSWSFFRYFSEKKIGKRFEVFACQNGSTFHTVFVSGKSQVNCKYNWTLTHKKVEAKF